MPFRRIVLSLLLVLTSAAAAAADPPATPTTSADDGVERYGLVVGAVDLGIGALMLVTQRPEVGFGHIFGAALVHELYGNRSGAYFSLAARTTLPVVGGMAGVLVAGCAGDLSDCDEGKVVAGVVVGAAAAMILDWTVLAKRPADSSGSSWLPVAAVSPTGFHVGLAAGF